MQDIQLGQKVKDKITGLEGIATGHCNYISGCDQVLVQPPVNKDGASQESRWFDVQRLEVINPTAIVLDNEKTPGFDAPAPVR